MLKRRDFIFKRNGRLLMVFHIPSTLGITWFRHGLVAFQFRGHFFQAYVGDRMRYERP